MIFLSLLVSLLKNLKHANIVTLHDIIHTEKCLTLVFEYVVGDVHVFYSSSYFCLFLHLILSHLCSVSFPGEGPQTVFGWLWEHNERL